MKTKTLYQVREYNGNEYSKQLGCKLRDRSSALKIIRRLKLNRRNVFAAAIKIAA